MTDEELRLLLTEILVRIRAGGVPCGALRTALETEVRPVVDAAISRRNTR